METLTIAFENESMLNAFLRWFKTQGIDSFESEVGELTVDYSQEKNGIIQMFPTNTN